MLFDLTYLWYFGAKQDRDPSVAKAVDGKVLERDLGLGAADSGSQLGTEKVSSWRERRRPPAAARASWSLGILLNNLPIVAMRGSRNVQKLCASFEKCIRAPEQPQRK